MLFDFNKKNTLIIIPARGGSKRVRNKNLRKLLNKELLVYSIEQCKKIKSAITIVSTDSNEIRELAESFNIFVPFLRPNYLSKDSSSSRSVIIHALHYFYKNFSIIPKYVGLKPPTNPFIKEKSIEGVIERLQKSNNQINSCVTISEASTHPFRIITLNKNKQITNGIFKIDGKTINDIERSQDWPKSFEGSPAFRLSKTKYFHDEIISQNYFNKEKTYDAKNSLGYQISKIEAFDIDNEVDLTLAEAISNTSYNKTSETKS